ncbi:MAG: serine/threonine protein kinase [Deltaproteobacteria bacterium]|nr:serine/threonine protein kinase [Deltaproteobacteria bacterium]
MTSERYGKYELIERIARGGMAEVFKGRVKGAAGFEKVVAIKRLHPHLSEDNEMVAMLKDEARLVSNMVHPNICQVFDFDKVGDTYYLAMEYIHGKDISTIARYERQMQGKIPVNIALYIIRQTLTGLDFAHRATDPVTGNPLNIIHRDISPQNVIVSYNGGVKIIDFGIAKAAESMHHTQNGVIKGKFRYMAPEQAMGKDIDHRIDIFAIGVMLYELLLGDIHSKGATDAELIIKAQMANFQPISQLVPDLPLGLDMIVMKALSPDKNMRFPSARTFRNALDTVVKREGMEVAPEVIANYLRKLFPDPYSGGSRVDEVELSMGNIMELSPEPEMRTGNYRIGNNPPTGVNSSPSNTAPVAVYSPSVPLPPPPQAELLDFSAEVKPPEVEPPVVNQPSPQKSGRATSVEARVARRRARQEKKIEQKQREVEIKQQLAQKDYSAIPRPPRKPVIGPFIDRLGKAFVNTLINLFLIITVSGVGLVVFYIARGSEAPKDQSESSSLKKNSGIKKTACKKGLVELTVKSSPSGGTVVIDGEVIGKKTPVYNMQIEMCYNTPHIIRIEKGKLFAEENFQFPVDSKRLQIELKLTSSGSAGASSGRTHVNTYSKSSKVPSGNSMKVETPDMKSDDSREIQPVEKSATESRVPGGSGLLKITCSEACTILVNGRNKGNIKSIQLRGRDTPYKVQAIWKDGKKSELKHVIILSNKKQYVYFGR